ncbi:YncE family protein [Roseomonas sp. BN140053]|uniref:YncE family protein n=1 Tax=Roseomonas sp. BN140053 TaxID=3391898 RepID=UPI0039ED8BF7
MPSRLLARLSALVLAVPLLAGAARAGEDLVYVLNSGDANIQVLDGRTRAEIRRISVLREVHHIVATPDGAQILIGDSGGNEMLFLDAATGEVKRRERISNPYHLAFTPDGKRLVVTSLRRGQVDVYAWDGQALKLEGRVRVGDMPSHLAFRPDSNVAYVTLQGEKNIAAIDLNTREILWKQEVGRDPAGILWHDGKLLVGVMGSNYLSVVNPENHAVEREVVVGRGAHQIFPSPDGSVLYATTRVDSRVVALEPRDLSIRRVYEVPGGPDDLSFAPDGRIWATLRWAQKVGILDLATGEVDTVRVGRSPHGILYRPADAAVAQAQPATPAAAR